LLILQILYAWLWYEVGYKWGYGLFLYIIEGILLPIGVSKFMLFRKTPALNIDKKWRIKFYWSSSVLYLVSYMIGMYIYMIVSGYQTAHHDWGGGVAELEAIGQWIITSFVLRQTMKYHEFESYKRNRPEE
jgi:hypothetical protein